MVFTHNYEMKISSCDLTTIELTISREGLMREK